MIKTTQTNGRHLGGQNVDLAYRLLREQRIPVMGQDVEGTCSRKVTFDTDTGAITVRRL